MARRISDRCDNAFLRKNVKDSLKVAADIASDVKTFCNRQVERKFLLSNSILNL